MSTTGGTPRQGTVYVDEEPDERRQEVQARGDGLRAPRSCARDDKPGITNLIEILAGRARHHARRRSSATSTARGYGDFKTAVGEEVAEWLRPRARALRELRAGRRPRSRTSWRAGRREGAARSRPGRSPTCARRWASARQPDPEAAACALLHGRAADRRAGAGPRRLRGAVRPPALADAARGAGPAGGRPGRGRHRLPRPPRVARRASIWRPRPSSWC